MLPVRWSALLSSKLKQIFSKKEGHLIVFKQLAAFGVLTVTAVEDVERTVVMRGLHIFNIILHLHLHRIAIIVLPTLEFLVTVLALQAFQGPFLPSRPHVLAIKKNYRLVGFLEALNELLWA